MDTNLLYYGDNLSILRDYIPDGSVDLVYLDPPFNSNRDYNVIFKDESGNNSDAQLLAFEDTWHWGPNAEEIYAFLTNTSRHKGRVPDSVSSLIAALRSGIGENQMLAYLVEMAVRLVELHRTLKPTGSLYLHADPTASHYLKVILDGVFGPLNFRSEIIWKRTSAHNTAKRYGPVHDVILFYSREPNSSRWNSQLQPYSDEYLKSHYGNTEKDGRQYRLNDITGSGTRNGETGQPWRGFDPTTLGRHWTRPPSELDALDALGTIHWPKKGWPAVKRYLTGGVALQDVWTDLPPVNSQAKERLGWDTQKPIALLERIVASSSVPGDVILDPFCGCGTALIAAEKLQRQWIGIDVTYLAIAVMRARLRDSFGLDDVKVIGQPTELSGATAMAQSPDGRYQFQYWCLTLVDAQPVGGTEKKGADRGIDGKIVFTSEGGRLEQVLVSVKSGKVTSSQVRDLKGTIERERAAIGLFITLEEPTKEMKREADTAGFYHSDLWNRDYPRIQIMTIKQLLEEKRKPELPAFVMPTFEKAQRVAKKGAEQATLFEPAVKVVDVAVEEIPEEDESEEVDVPF